MVGGFLADFLFDLLPLDAEGQIGEGVGFGVQLLPLHDEPGVGNVSGEVLAVFGLLVVAAQEIGDGLDEVEEVWVGHVKSRGRRAQIKPG